MKPDELRALNRTALDPAQSVVVEAVAGSGKTWLLVSRIVRLLLAGTAPSEILAITFTRKAAQEMAERLREWLHTLAMSDDAGAREFLRQREVSADDLDEALARARLLYEQFLTAQPPITIATFHSWFLQLLRRAPLEAGALGDVTLVEQTGALLDEAWQRLAARLQREPDSPLAQLLDRLFSHYGLESTRRLLRNFVMRRADWWAYTQGRSDPVAWALQEIAASMALDPEEDVAAAFAQDATLGEDLDAYATLLERNTPTDREQAAVYRAAQTSGDAGAWLDAACALLLKQDGTPKDRKASGAQARRLGAAGEARFIALHARLAQRLVDACQRRANLACYRANEAGLACGMALLEAYQTVKAERQAIDYGDIEWHAYRLVSHAEHAAYMHHKLDARYRHVLLDEFQDTNPLQWLTLRSWFAAANEADSRPTVFLVGDPKQSIYRFRRAESRLFGQAAAYLEQGFAARRVVQHESRRCAQAVIEVVNTLFSREADFAGFEAHSAHHAKRPGRVEVLPIVQKTGTDPVFAPKSGSVPVFSLRNPLERPLQIEEDLRRETEAAALARRIREIVGVWAIEGTDGITRPASFRDIMILVKRRTHLAIYERALRSAEVPFITSRQGGLLGTLEAKDMIALLEFIVSPFADLKLAHALRTPIFDCSDEDLIALAERGERTWWERLQAIAAEGKAVATLTRAHRLLARWLDASDGLPVHDQLDRIYFEGDVIRRYESAAPEAMRGAVVANLQAFMQRALDADAGRYPSLPRFLHELVDLADAAADEAPDEGIVGDAGDAVRIFTVHGAKGLEKPIVWLLDVAAGQEPSDSYGVLVDWPIDADRPAHFSVCTRKAEHGATQRRLNETQDALARREELNLLYVAMTRAQQALIVSGCDGRGREGSWYEKVRAAVRTVTAGDPAQDDPGSTATYGSDLAEPVSVIEARHPESRGAHPAGALREPLPTGTRRAAATRAERYGTQFHALMEWLAAKPGTDPDFVRDRLRITRGEFDAMWRDAQRLLREPALARFFDSAQYVRAENEVSYVTATGELRRIDRLVEFKDELWVVDYKTGALPHDPALLASYEAQLRDYATALATIAADKAVRAMLVFASGERHIVSSGSSSNTRPS